MSNDDAGQRATLDLARRIVERGTDGMCPSCDEYSVPEDWLAMAEEVLRLHALRSETATGTPDAALVKLARERIKEVDGNPIPCNCEGCQFARELLRLSDTVTETRAPKEEEPYFILNGYERKWRSYSHRFGPVVSYEDIVEWSGINSDSNIIRERVYTVTYTRGKDGKSGTLCAGDTTPFVSGMVFNVTRTGAA